MDFTCYELPVLPILGIYGGLFSGGYVTVLILCRNQRLRACQFSTTV